MRAAGLTAEIFSTPGHPIVLGEWRGAGANAPTVLIYGHYDVQPAEPLDAWRTPPFTPTRLGDDLHARGASDDKGQLLCQVLALESHLRSGAVLPVNVVCIVDGEEEHGSPHLGPFLSACRSWLRPDVAVVSDTPMRGPGWPSLIVSTRGALSLRLALRRSGDDAHSGQFGGAVPDAAHAICRLVGDLLDDRGHIRVPGFYARVRRRSPGARASSPGDAPPDPQILAAAGARRGAGEAGFTAYERTTLRPAVTVTGVRAGYVGGGAKSAVPASAEADLNFRLVDDQDPEQIERLVRRRLLAATPDPFTLTISVGSTARPTRMDRRHPALLLAAEALRRGFGRAPALLGAGGTIPIIHDIQRVFGIPTVLMGFALPDDRLHGPNEKVNLPTLERGIASCIHFLDLVGRRGELGSDADRAAA
jgi:acetylornithine deacetylase/succinyl-diaminopimelate desuccinylase-like protein